MKKSFLFFLIFLMLCISFPEYAAGNDADVHKIWMNENFSNPENLDNKTVVATILDILEFDFQEEESLALIDYATSFIPDLDDFAKWRKSGEADPLYRHKIEALKAVEAYLDSTYPDSEEAVMAKIRRLRVESLSADMQNEWDSMLEYYNSTYGESPSPAMKSLLTMIRGYSYLNKTFRQGFDDTDQYEEIFRIEKEALDYLSPYISEVPSTALKDSPENTLSEKTLIELFRLLGLLKGVPSDSFVAGYYDAIFNSPDSEKDSMKDSMELTFIGEYPCNAPYYLEKAETLASETLNREHPLVLHINLDKDNFLFNKMYPEYIFPDSLYSDNTVLSYYPGSSPHSALARLRKTIRSAARGNISPDEDEIKTDLNIAVKSLGEDNPEIIRLFSELQQLGILLSGNPSSTFLNPQEFFSPAVMEKHKNLFLLYSMDALRKFSHLNLEVAKDRIDNIRFSKLSDIPVSALSMKMLFSAADFYFNRVYNFLTGSIVLPSFSQFNAIYGSDYFKNPLYWKVHNLNIKTALEHGKKNFEEGIGLTTDILDVATFPAKDYIKYHYLNAAADLYARFTNERKKTFNLRKDVLATAQTLNPSLKIAASSEDIFLFDDWNGISDSNNDLINGHRQYILSSSRNSLDPAVISMIGENYLLRGDFEKALEMFNKALEAYNEMYGPGVISPKLLGILEILSNYYHFSGNFTDEERSDAQLREILNSTPELTFSEIENGVKSGLYTRSRGDISNIMLELGSSLYHLFNLINLSGGQNDYIFNTRLLPLMTQMLSTAIYNWNIVKNWNINNSSGIPMTQQLSRFSSMIEEIAETHDKNKIPFLSDQNYRALLRVLRNYNYIAVNENKKALRYSSLLKGNKVTPDNIWDWMTHLDILVKDNNLKEVDKTIYRIESQSGSLRLIEDQVESSLRPYKFFSALQKNDLKSAFQTANDDYQKKKDYINGDFQFLTSSEQENYLNSISDPAMLLMILLSYLPEASPAGLYYNCAAFHTGILLRSQQSTLDAIRSSHDPLILAEFEKLSEAKNALRTEFVGLGNRNNEERDSTTDNYQFSDATLKAYDKYLKLKNDIARAEQALFTKIAENRGERLEDVTWQEILSRLPQNSVAMEFVFSQNNIYALLLSHRHKEPIAIRMGDIDVLAKKINAAGANTAAVAKNLYREDDLELYEILWQPLEKFIADADTIYFTAPGLLNCIAFNAIPTPDGKRIFDKYNLVQLTTTAQLVFDNIESAPVNLTLLGDILYDELQTPVTPDSPDFRSIDFNYSFESADEEEDMDESGDQRALKKTNFRHLPFTAIEIEDISSLFPIENVFAGRKLNATEKWLRNNIAEHQPDVLHLATHGYYISPGAHVKRFPFLKNKGDGSMQRSGIALAGAEKTWKGSMDSPDDNDGILTAAEVSSLDLGKTGLVVLSACETALGDFSVEGVFGLQRGFKQAGVQSLMLSLWSVNDRSTSIFMEEFYRNIKNGDSRHSAWRKSIEKVRGEYSEPYYWAPFILLDAY